MGTANVSYTLEKPISNMSIGGGDARKLAQPVNRHVQVHWSTPPSFKTASFGAVFEGVRHLNSNIEWYEGLKEVDTGRLSYSRRITHNLKVKLCVIPVSIDTGRDTETDAYLRDAVPANRDRQRETLHTIKAEQVI